MNDDIRKILDDTYDDAREDSIRSMIGDFYSRKMLSTTVLIWFWAIVFLVAAGYTAMKFFETDEAQNQIMYASIFVCLVQFIGLMKVFAWQMMARNSVKREIKRLELRIAELAKALDKTARAGSH
ncbi:MAG TPA: hypothetical protein PKH24_20395 [Sedimentisphaerales bacterium]|jgi:hypothetical protein|nr:hypothetical protein [Sedimentisphaerales bacterium]HNU31565.1 hypothetical protein [Sedimentisphaerales bacterium]